MLIFALCGLFWAYTGHQLGQVLPPVTVFGFIVAGLMEWLIEALIFGCCIKYLSK